ncbi:unnamed protein product [Mucor circinelloides]|uniref:Uncharacterized protein n=1 Tax=Mucor circinelloides f. circinelloides (strain 1006PhL) TaxID=1220926 RepID=S2JMW7_MUCC1|nr:hypothetical protein HMPREF1544_01417 [Mucor circinelloides 1006PhL]KAG1110662.1 hypothetical protein G6F42_015262 [Rhizopus arrhizus]
MRRTSSLHCLSQLPPDISRFNPQAEDILTDEDLLELFRIVKQIIRKKPDTERIAKLYFCIVYAMGDLYQFYKPIHNDVLVFKDDSSAASPTIAEVQLPLSVSCCQSTSTSDGTPSRETPTMTTPTTATQSPPVESTSTSAGPVPQRILSVSYLTNPSPPMKAGPPQLPQIVSRPADETSTDQYSVRPYTNIRPIYPSSAAYQPPWTTVDEQNSSSSQSSNLQHTPNLPQYNHLTHPHQPHNPPQPLGNRFPHLNTLMNGTGTEVLMEPKQRGFYYQDGRITREPALLQRYAEQGVLTQASLMRKRKKTFGSEPDFPYELSTIPAPVKKPKIPHRHGEFKQRRDDIISRMRTIMMADLEQKAQRLPSHFTLGIEKACLPSDINVDNLSTEEASKLLSPALRILTQHSNMKPHLDNGMNQNGIYYNNDYFRLYMAFVQFQNIFETLFPNEVIKISTASTPVSLDDTSNMPSPGSMAERDKDRERNANMKAYRGWIEPFLTETNWAAFRRNIMVGERIMQLTSVVGQGVLLMTKELSGSKLHLTFTNNEWDEFIQGLSQGLWDETIDWSHDEDETTEERRNIGGSLLVHELRLKFATHFWFTEEGTVVPPAERKMLRARERQNNK